MNEEVRIKSYQFLLQNACIWVFLMVFIMQVVAEIAIEPFSWIPFCICPFWLPCLIGALITRFGCKTYDIFSREGIKRVRKDKILFEISWDNVGSLVYDGFWGIIMLRPFVLYVHLTNPLKEVEKRNADSEDCIGIPVSPKNLKRIAALLPPELTIKK